MSSCIRHCGVGRLVVEIDHVSELHAHLGLWLVVLVRLAVRLVLCSLTFDSDNVEGLDDGEDLVEVEVAVLSSEAAKRMASTTSSEVSNPDSSARDQLSGRSFVIMSSRMLMRIEWPMSQSSRYVRSDDFCCT